MVQYTSQNNVLFIDLLYPVVVWIAMLLSRTVSANLMPFSRLSEVTLNMYNLSPSCLRINLPLAYVPINVAKQIASMVVISSDLATLTITMK